ncbi:HNH endonuclease [Pseudooceanicola sp.]|uniref:HNH endonuclease n=1 Tax=Pseudooceanicola sp. TaxID=1914328 RepID=UPI004059BA7F
MRKLGESTDRHAGKHVLEQRLYCLAAEAVLTGASLDDLMALRECDRCGRCFDPAALEVAHVHPVSSGVSLGAENLMIVCCQCH